MKQELIKKVRELVNVCINKNEELYIEMCRCYSVNITPSTKAVRYYVPKSMKVTDINKIVNICECVLTYK